MAKQGIHHAVARAHHPETVGKCERFWETLKGEFLERVELEDISDARERLEHFIAHYNFFRPHQGIDGLVPADRFFAAEEALRRTHEARLAHDELALALERVPRSREQTMEAVTEAVMVEAKATGRRRRGKKRLRFEVPEKMPSGVRELWRWAPSEALPPLEVHRPPWSSWRGAGPRGRLKARQPQVTGAG